MWRTQVFVGAELSLDHSQSDFARVLKFSLNAVVELINSNVADYRVTMVNRDGYVFFFATGQGTQTADMRKVSMEPTR